MIEYSKHTVDSPCIIMTISEKYRDKTNRRLLKQSGFVDASSLQVILFDVDKVREYEDGVYLLHENDIIVKYLFDLFNIKTTLIIFYFDDNRPDSVYKTGEGDDKRNVLTAAEALYLLGFDSDKYKII